MARGSRSARGRDARIRAAAAAPARRLSRRRLIGVLAVLALVLVTVVAVTAVVLKSRADSASAARAALSYTPTAPSTPDLTAANVAVVGDETTSSSARGVTAADRWTSLMAQALDARVTVLAAAGSGYTTKDAAGRTFGSRTDGIDDGTAVVVFFGSSNDARAASISLARAATLAFSAAKRRAPDARILVVGPAVTGSAPAADLMRVRAALRGAARIAGATYVDPIAQGWLSIPKTGATASTRLSEAQEAVLARRFAVALGPLLG